MFFVFFFFFFFFFFLLLYNITTGGSKQFKSDPSLDNRKVFGEALRLFSFAIPFLHQLSNCSNITFLNKMVQCDGGRTAAQRQKQYDEEAHSFTSIRVMVVRSSTANPRKKAYERRDVDLSALISRSYPGG